MACLLFLKMFAILRCGTLISVGNTFHAGRIEAMTIVNGSSESSTRTKRSGPSVFFTIYRLKLGLVTMYKIFGNLFLLVLSKLQL